MWDFLKSLQTLYLLDGLDEWRQSAVYSKNSVIDANCNWKIVKDISVIFPNNCISIFCLTFHVETVVLSDSSSLMVTSYHGDPLWVFYF